MSQYRSDIDGLRAIAVLSVVVFHAFPYLLGAGFIGVDVFFVISGFLISTIIIENLDRGTFSFAEFYARRVRRIFPALLLMLLACLAFGWFVLLADEYWQLGEHTVASTGFFSNLVLWSEAGYFDRASATKPLLHLWSLGIEEQFYLVWPLLLFLAWKTRFNLLLFVTILAALSFGLNVAIAGHNGVADFYSPLTRFWELLCGALLAALAPQRANSRNDAVADGSLVSNCTSLLGVGLLAYGFVCISRDADFPGAWALLPVVGATLVIFAGPKALFNRVVLSNPILVWFGLISYPLYLWHWPLLSYARIIEGGHPGRAVVGGAVLVAVALAWLTYTLIERPIRFGKHGRGATSVLALLMVCMGATGFVVYHLDGLGGRAAVSVNNMIASSGDDGGDGGRLTVDCGLPTQERVLFQDCGSDNRGGVKYALLGDSKAHAFYRGLVRTSADNGRWKVIGGNGSHGPLVPIISDEPDYAVYQKLARVAVDEVSKDHEIEDVLIVVAMRAIFQVKDTVRDGNYSYYDYTYLQRLNASNNYEKAHAGLKQAISKLAAAGKKVVILVDNPALPEPGNCVGHKTSIKLLNKVLGLEKRDLFQACFLPLSQFEEETTLYKKLLNQLQSEFPDSLALFDATDIYCDHGTGICGPTRDGRFLYSFTDHVSDYAAGLVGARLNAYLNKPFRRLTAIPSHKS